MERGADAGDRRVWLVASTDQAAPVVAEVIAVDTALRRQLWTGVSPAERRRLSEILRRLQGNLGSILDDQYVKERQAFGQPIAGFQNTRFKLAEIGDGDRRGRGVHRQGDPGPQPGPAHRHRVPRARPPEVGGAATA